MLTVSAHGVSSASATANGTSVVAATEHDQAGEMADPTHHLLLFFTEALARVCAWGLVHEECLDLAFAKLEECFTADHALFDEPALLKHKEIWDMVRYDKHGKEKENNFFTWCRKIAAIRDADGTSKEPAASCDQERKCYKIEDAHGASHRRPHMQSLFACFCKCDEQWSRNEATIFRMHPK